MPLFMRLENRKEPDIGRISNGQDVPRSIPWEVSIQGKHPKLNFTGHFCGATILNEDTLLSAAHCFYEAGSIGFTIRAGSKRKSSGGQVKEIYKPWTS